MTFNELLAKYGLDEEKTTSFLADMKANKIFTTSEENMDIRHGKLKEDHATQGKQLEEANALIETLKKDAKGNEDLLKKITDYDARVAQLEKENQELRAESGMDRMLIAAGAKQTDLDYLKFQWRKKGEIAFDDQGEIKGGDDIVAALKTQCPAQFENGGGKKYEERKLPGGNEGRTMEPQSLADALRMTYENPTT